MSKYNNTSLDSIRLIAPLMLSLYLCIGFIPNLDAVDKIAPQWLFMSVLNAINITYFFLKRRIIADYLTLTIKNTLSLTYLAFIIWATGSIIYAINPTEVLVNIARQLNVFLMFIVMTVYFFSIKNKLKLIPTIICIILIAELYFVFNEAISMIKELGLINPGKLKGVTANRNITAFSIANKIPIVLFLIHLSKNLRVKIFWAFILSFCFVALSMIQSRASFIASGLIFISYFTFNILMYFRVRKTSTQLIALLYLLVPLIFSVIINQSVISDKGADVIQRASTIKLDTNEGSINQRLRYYEDVLTHISSNPILGVGLGNWKLKSIDYDAKDIVGYVVPYHAHSDFIQLGAELGIIGFFLYLSIFILALYYVYILIRFSDLQIDQKVFLFLLLTALGVYSIDANLNFPIARPQVLVTWTFLLAAISVFYQNYNKKKVLKTKRNKLINTSFLLGAFIFVTPSIYTNSKVYESLKGQMFLLQDFNSNKFNVPLNKLETLVPEIPNITVTTIPINSVKARYYVNAKKYDKALELIEKGTNANPFLYYSEILKSQIYQEKGQLDSAKFYAQKAFFGLPNNDLHASRYLNLINITRDRKALEESFKLLTNKNKENNWKNYLIIASGLYPPNNTALVEKAKQAVELFPNNQEFKALYNRIAVGQAGIASASSYSSKGLEYFNSKNYTNAAVEFEKALKANPLDYAHFENAATANYLIGNLEKAIEQINVVIEDLNPLNGKCEYIKALIYIKMGDPIGACPFLATARDSGFSQADASFNQYCR
jgi:O-antigen ligase